MKTITLAIAFFGLTMGVVANNEEDKPKNFSITGKVLDHNESLTGVKVMLDGEQVVVYTDFEGNFTLDNIVPGEHTISFSLITYNNKEIKINSATINNLEIELEAK